MKKRILLILGGILMFTMLAACGKKKEITDIKSLNLTYSTGTYMNGSVAYSLKVKDGKYTATYKPDEVAEKDAFVMETDKAFADKITAILNEHKVIKWNGFNKVSKNVMDGNSFTLRIYYGNSKEVYAHGYERRPDNYGVVIGTLEGAFHELFGQ